MFVAIDATENTILGHIHPVVELLFISVHAVLGLLGVHIRHSDQTSIAARVPDLRNGATTAATAPTRATLTVSLPAACTTFSIGICRAVPAATADPEVLRIYADWGARFLAHKNAIVLGY